MPNSDNYKTKTIIINILIVIQLDGVLTIILFFNNKILDVIIWLYT